MLKEYKLQRPGYKQRWYRHEPYHVDLGPGAGRHPQFTSPAQRWRTEP